MASVTTSNHLVACAVLAGGQGSRLAALTSDQPKHLLRVGEESLLEHTLKKVYRVAPDHVVLYRPRGRAAVDVVVDLTPRPARTRLEVCDSEVAFGPWRAIVDLLQRTEASVILGAGPDVFSPGLEYAPLLDLLRVKQADVVVAMGPAPAAERAAVYTVAPDGRVLSWERRPSSNGQELLNLSGYALTRAALERLERAGFSSFLEDEVQPFVIAELRTFAYVVPGLSVNVNAPIDLERARELAVSRAHGAGSESPRSVV